MKKVLCTLLLTPPVLVILWVLHRAFFVPDNHIGFEPYLFMTTAGFAVVSAWLSRGRWRVAAMAVSVLTVAVIAFAVHFNLLLQYEEWIQRGMPDKPDWAQLG